MLLRTAKLVKNSRDFKNCYSAQHFPGCPDLLVLGSSCPRILSVSSLLSRSLKAHFPKPQTKVAVQKSFKGKLRKGPLFLLFPMNFHANPNHSLG